MWKLRAPENNKLWQVYRLKNLLPSAHGIFASHLCKTLSSSNRNFEDPNEQSWLEEALRCAEAKHQKQGISLSKGLAHRMVSECSKRRDLKLGRRIHSLMAINKLDCVAFLANHLIRLFASCASLAEAEQVFIKVTNPDQYTWNAIIDAYVKHGEAELALKLYDKMLRKGGKPDKFTFPSILKACGSIGAIERGMEIHGQVVKLGLQSDPFVGSSLVDMYAKCGNLEAARAIFDKLSTRDVVTWGSMISGYAQNDKGHLALQCYEQMQQAGIKPDRFTFPSLLRACGSLGAIEQGTFIHEQIVKEGLRSDVVVEVAIVDMYAKCGNLDKARNVFENLKHRDVVAWGAMIGGYTDNGQGQLALEFYESMQQEGIKPDMIIFSSALKACSSIGAIEQGKRIHQQLVESGVQSDIVLGSILVDMYAKCGNLEEARKMFLKLAKHDLAAWGAIISGYAQAGEVGLALQCFEDMQDRDIKVNDIAFTSVLSACTHTGLVDEALRCFYMMKQVHGLHPDIHHVTCMVDLLGQAGQLQEAEHLLKAVNVLGICPWIALLNACRTHCNVELGRRSFNVIVQLEPVYVQAYVLMSNIYANAHMNDDAHRVDLMRKLACAHQD